MRPVLYADDFVADMQGPDGVDLFEAGAASMTNPWNPDTHPVEHDLWRSVRPMSDEWVCRYWQTIHLGPTDECPRHKINDGQDLDRGCGFYDLVKTACYSGGIATAVVVKGTTEIVLSGSIPETTTKATA